MAAWMNRTGQPVWRARFAPVEVGVYPAVAELRDSDGLTRLGQLSFVDSVSSRRLRPCQPPRFAFLRVSQRSAVFPIGITWRLSVIAICYVAQDGKTFEKLATNGANWLRIWTGL